LNIQAGLRDLPAMRISLAQAIAETNSPFSLRISSYWLVKEFRDDPEVNRMLVEAYGF
jgi:hypothetical protein